MALEPPPAVEELARRDVGEHDRAVLGDEQHRDRRVLHHRVEQELALDELEPLVAQHVAERVVRVDEVAHLVVAAPVQAERDSRRRGSSITVPLERAEHREQRAQRRAHDDEQQQQRHDEDTGGDRHVVVRKRTVEADDGRDHEREQDAHCGGQPHRE